MKKLTVLLALLLLFACFAGCAEKETDKPVPPPVVEPDDTAVEAVADANFADGFGILGLNSASDGTSVKSWMKLGRAEPVWRLAQWGSRYDLNSPLQKSVTTQKMILADASKRAELDRTSGKLTLALDATKEYDERADSRVMWAHILIEQEFSAFKQYKLDTMESLRATLDFTVTKAEKGAIETEEPAKTLPAQFLQYFYIVNYNQDSAGFGSFLWFGLCYLDTRYDCTSLSYGQDFAGGNAGNYIYSLGGDTLMGGERFQTGKQYNVDLDILPYVSDALAKAAEHGFMHNTKLSDCVVTGMNIGWEIPGAWNVSATFEKLSLQATFKK